MKSLVFARRNIKEIMRDPINMAFGLGFPLVLLFLLSAIQANIPVDTFGIKKLAPGVAAFGFSFLSLFCGMLIAKDRSSSYLMRLFASPMKSSDFIIGYTLPVLPLAIAQSTLIFIVSFFLGLPVNGNVLLAIVVLIPSAVLFIGLGLLVGSIFNDKAVGGICGALLTNISAWLSGTWFELELMGPSFKTVANLLPFVHSVEAAKAAISGNFGEIFPHLWWVLAYAFIAMAVAIWVFRKKMNGQNV
jgi:ABC-2 type transport system permease protein